ncbi:cell number regulator 8-like [Melia azedarach]|uniref:Cell number regulator 8-like n=1 Tax=Melia azedarach TaxID=155640 RepID=A0ACC1X0I5_MELAZ|nr:cell number regulator 8-like [Melia azedarach]
MANDHNNNGDNVNNDSESRPLLSNHVADAENEKKSNVDGKKDGVKFQKVLSDEKSEARESGGYGWTADGLPLSHGSVMGEPMGRTQWDSSLFACLGRNDEFCSSDLEVCLLGSMAPCVLYGSNVERLASAPGTFANHCLPYSGLYLIGNAFFGWNCLAPWFSYPSRTAIRRKFNLEGSFEALNRSCGCCGSCVEDELQREQCESSCDFATHVFCHLCALCQEGRELRRRLPHPGFNAQPVLVMIPPGEQTMGR